MKIICASRNYFCDISGFDPGTVIATIASAATTKYIFIDIVTNEQTVEIEAFVKDNKNNA